jgi:acyl-CoA synthetase (AMP-forming)/AMP-acid ligase II
MYPSSTTDDANNNSSDVDNLNLLSSDINYGSYILLSTFLAEILCTRLSLGVVNTATTTTTLLPFETTTVCNGHDNNDDDTNDGSGGGGTSNVRKVGISIPEGPFLPLFILTIHSLNIAISEHWIATVVRSIDDDDIKECWNDNTNEEPEISIPPQQMRRTRRRNKCNGVAMVPLELDDGPDRLCHMLADANPDFILVDEQQTQNNNSIQQTQQQQYTFVNYVTLVSEAMTLYHKHMQKYKNKNDDVSSLMEYLWPYKIRNNTLDSIRYPNIAVAESYDVPRLVAIGLVRRLLASSSSYPNVFSIRVIESMTNNHHHQQSDEDRHIVSHIVYTSGTTGRPKGCVSSLASLQHYVRAKNVAHEINNTSKVLLASAVTFDPCLSDIIATCIANATLCLTSREQLYGHTGGNNGGLGSVLRLLEITHILCTPSLWSNVELSVENNNISSYYNNLQNIALGGEPIPKAMVQRWARTQRKDGSLSRNYPRLCATYGVTEACVYQTFGEVFILECNDDEMMKEMEEEASSSLVVNLPGKNVGQSLIGTNISICRPYSQDNDDNDGAELMSQSSGPKIGEVVLSGAQIDALSSYLNSIELSSRVFVQGIDDGALGVNDTYFYRTGDLGCIDPMTRNLHILGRIKGDGMVKFNGIRIELSEIENACIDDNAHDEEDRLVIDCMATLSVSLSRSCDNDSEQQNNQLVAYCLLSSGSLLELGVRSQDLTSGIIVAPGPLLALLRTRCDRRVRKGCTPSVFVIIDRLPLSPTGKRCRSSLPPLSECSIMNSSASDNENKKSLRECGKVGSIVANKICECLNLQPCQRQLVTLGESIHALFV